MKNKKQLSVLANAKLNLHLEILNKRKDGYHDLSSIFQSVTLADKVTVSVCEGSGISVVTKNAVIDGKNLAEHAAELFLEASGMNVAVQIEIDKRIPLSAGLAGGSADAAAVLTCLNWMTGFPFSEAQLAKLGEKLGADVPFCLVGGTKLAEGIGERLTSAPALPSLLVILVKQHEKDSTGAMYKRLDGRDTIEPPITGQILSLLEREQLQKAAPLIKNSFLTVSDDRAEQQAICDRLLSAGAIAAGLSGAGPTIFGLFDFYDGDLIAGLKHDYKEVYLCETAGQAIEFE